MNKEMKIQEDITRNQHRLTNHLIKQNKRYREAVDKIIKAIPIRYKNELELSTSIIKIADIVNDLKLEELE